MADHISRRSLLKAAGVTGLGALASCDDVALPGIGAKPSDASASPSEPPSTTPTTLPSSGTGFTYEVQYSDAEWRALLSPAEYNILREGGTERRNSHYLTRTTDAGTYQCKGCDLTIYDSTQKVILDIGWVFFRHSLQDSVLLGIDDKAIEAHCRRCGSHLGHVLYVESEILHCINGTALDFKAT